MNEHPIIFGVPIAQEPLITQHCFGDCGRISLGAIIDHETGLSFLPCKHDDCQYEERRSEAFGEVQGCEFIMRKLK